MHAKSKGKIMYNSRQHEYFFFNNTYYTCWSLLKLLAIINLFHGLFGFTDIKFASDFAGLDFYCRCKSCNGKNKDNFLLHIIRHALSLTRIILGTPV
jgi:hypothetical protein